MDFWIWYIKWLLENWSYFLSFEQAFEKRKQTSIKQIKQLLTPNMKIFLNDKKID